MFETEQATCVLPVNCNCISAASSIVWQVHAGGAAADACALTLAVYSSDGSSGDRQPGSAAVPVNALRNRAIALAATEV